MRRSKLRQDGLNVIPLIDVMLVLLCIVLSISTFIARGDIAVNLPKSKSGTGETKKEIITIAIDVNNTIYYDGEVILEDEFKEKISSLDKQTPVVLRSDKDAKFESFVKVIDVLKYNNHENFAIATEIRN
ncbi:MAG: TonB system transport protein ExbD [Campylobacteraceae bacterium]|nr:TonB system transport protein ExbD [Campylobacteraceae bacterium]